MSVPSREKPGSAGRRDRVLTDKSTEKDFDMKPTAKAGGRQAYSLAVRIEPDGRELSLKGRDAWAALQLIRAGEAGCTPIDQPGPRWSGYVHKLRKAGLVIETIHESHGGPFPGTHARYRLATELTVLREPGGAHAGA